VYPSTYSTSSAREGYKTTYLNALVGSSHTNSNHCPHLYECMVALLLQVSCVHCHTVLSYDMSIKKRKHSVTGWNPEMVIWALFVALSLASLLPTAVAVTVLNLTKLAGNQGVLQSITVRRDGGGLDTAAG
jgi:hypothetical protein